MVKDSDSERKNSLLPHRLLFLISRKGSFICIIPQPFTPVVEHWLEQEIAQWVYGIRHMVKDNSDNQRKTHSHHYMGYSFRLATRVLYAPPHRHGTLAGIRSSSMGPPWGIDPTTHCTMSKHSITDLILFLKGIDLRSTVYQQRSYVHCLVI